MILDKLKNIFGIKNKEQKIDDIVSAKVIAISKSLHKNKNSLEKIFSKSDDLIYRKIYLENSNTSLLLVCIDGMVERDLIADHILTPLQLEDNKGDITINLEKIKEKLITTLEVEISKGFQQLTRSLLSGNTLLFIEGYKQALMIGTTGWEARSIESPASEETIGGSREGFIESIKTNISLIRKRIKTPKLAVELLEVGRKTRTNIALVYLKGVINHELVGEVRNRIEEIDTDGIVGSSQIEQLIENHKWSIFPQIMSTERVDKTVGSILEGRITIIVDGTPFVLIAPVTFATFLNSPDDYYERSITSSAMRVVRYISYVLTTTLPALYLALTAYHPGMIPTPLVLTITESRMGLPFPTIVEVLIMEFTLEILTEASIRLPRPIGQAVSIVGGLVIGQAAVQAGIVSPLIIIVVSLTALTSFVIPVYSFTLSNRLIRFPLIIMGGLAGLYGIFMGWIFILIHLASIESFGVRYLGDFSPYKLEHLKDTIIKVPQGWMTQRPEILNVEDTKKQDIEKARMIVDE
ncbi:spore germination protein [Orenia metallireducens]|uniref:Spore germination protein n=1 Tax=Orenia metallireducens TaxID=1413210 RepID=A0A285GXK1_9FIRM|nr:spore germination protein [Orenia metallireducens]PRX25253.1 spore germination protein [Orenia metallireducens]SNY26981.1 spore germination protein [Orenia metallireducens]